MITKECFGWWLDGSSLELCKDCVISKECKDDWIKSGGRCSGFFDKEIERRQK